MDIIFLGIVIFLFLLAIFDLSVGVSNDAVNFLTSAVGSKAASFRRVMIVASIGVFIGAAMSNGMMDVARHGIFRPENLSFYDVIAIFMAVMVTDIILLDMFNTLGMPTSTTVSMVFELLGATFVVALFKISAPESTLGIGDYLGFSLSHRVPLCRQRIHMGNSCKFRFLRAGIQKPACRQRDRCQHAFHFCY